MSIPPEEGSSMVPEGPTSQFIRNVAGIEKAPWIHIDLNELGGDRVESVMLAAKDQLTNRDYEAVGQAQGKVRIAALAANGREEKPWAFSQDGMWTSIWGFTGKV